MKESLFIRQNKKKWTEFEQGLKSGARPKDTARLFVQITDDLSHARTFYPNRSVRAYLNGVCTLLFNIINRSSRFSLSGFSAFWTHSLPLAMYRARRQMLVSGLLFGLCFLLGVVTSRNDAGFAEEILGSGYVAMTEKNIGAGKPMDVYASGGEIETFLQIAVNNLFVAFRTFFMGVLMSIGTLIIMVYNGVMVGVFQYFFIERGLFWPSFLTIWTHGTLEIAGIIMAGGAGLTLGRGLVFPGTYTRFQAFRASARQGLKIMAGITPVFLLAAFIEGFLTRHTAFPDALRLVFILACLALVLLYFQWYPRKVARRGEGFLEEAGMPPPPPETPGLRAGAIPVAGEVFSATFGLIFRRTGAYLLLLTAASAFVALPVALTRSDLFFGRSTSGVTFFGPAQLFDFGNYPAMALLCGLAAAAILVLSIYFAPIPEELLRTVKDGGGRSRMAGCLATATAGVMLFAAMTASGNGWIIAGAFLILPYSILSAAVAALSHAGPLQAATLTGTILDRNWTKFAGVVLMFTVVALILYLVNVLVAWGLISTSMVWSLTDSHQAAAVIKLAIMVFLAAFAFFMWLTMLAVSACMLYFPLHESWFATHLLARINRMFSRP